jgi:transketolase
VRSAFATAIEEIAARDPRVVLLTGDLGFTVLEPFARRFPERFFNVGVAEQNMIGVATGLAESGWIPFAYSIAPFATLRPFEFIRNGPIAHGLPVRVVGVGGGFEYGYNGLSHFGVEDIAVMRSQPGMRVVVPADAEQARNGLLATWDLPGPMYYRLGKDDRPRVPGLGGRFAIGQAQQIRSGTDLLVVAMGAIAVEAAAAVDALAGRGVSSSFMLVDQFHLAGSMENLSAALRAHRLVMTVEAHYVDGGVGSYVAELIAEAGAGCRLVRCGVRRTPVGEIGSEKYMNERHGLTRERLVDTALAAVDGRTFVGGS